MTTTAPHHVFRSRHHPGSNDRAWVVASTLVQPIAICMLPVMVGALIAVLEGFAVLPFLTVGFPLALALAMAWTLFQLFGTIAEVHVRSGAAAVRTVSQVLRAPTASPDWQPIYELRTGASTLVLALGDATYELPRRHWPNADVLLEALRAARQPQTVTYQVSS
jgi:hypothetical protein